MMESRVSEEPEDGLCKIFPFLLMGEGEFKTSQISKPVGGSQTHTDQR